VGADPVRQISFRTPSLRSGHESVFVGHPRVARGSWRAWCPPLYARLVSDEETRAKLERHWDTAGNRDQEAAHDIYHEDCVVEWPQSGERVRGKADLQALRTAYPAQLEFNVRRILGGGDLWITEYRISYDGAPVHVVSIMEFRDGLVARETHYFADPFEPPDWRARWVELM
jgi:hypothetical protein